MSPRRSLILVVLVLLLAVPLAASAKLPAPKDKTIVVGVSIAGAKLGGGLTAAKVAWGPGGTCKPAPSATYTAFRCVWLGTKGASMDFLSVSGVLRQVRIVAGSGAKGPLAAFRTAKGIGIGSTEKAVRKAYKKFAPSAPGLLVLKGARGNTIFSIAQGKVNLISLVVP